MGRKPKLYIPLTVTFFDDDRIAQVGDGPTCLYLEMCVLARRIETDGLLSNGQLTRIPRPKRQQELSALLDAGLVAASGGAWQIVDWLDWNDSVAQIEARRAIDRFRKELSEDLRREIFARDDHRCRTCGTSDNLTIDHIVPVSKGGTHDPDNLQTLCGTCNVRKGNRPA